MGRINRKIGLSNSALQWLKQHNARELCEYMGAEGFIDEPFYYSIYEVTDYRPAMFVENEMEPYIRTVREYTQELVCSGGTMFMTALRDLRSGEIIKESLWTEDYLNQF